MNSMQTFSAPVLVLLLCLLAVPARCVVGCSGRLLGDTYLVSPTQYMFAQPPQTIMFWIFPLNNSYPVDESGSVSESSDGPMPVNYEGIIFNTGDYSDPDCDCNMRLVFVYLYNDFAVEVQYWKQTSTGWLRYHKVRVLEISLAMWTHVSYYVDEMVFHVNGVAAYNHSSNESSSTLTKEDYPYAVLGKDFVGNIDELRVYHDVAYLNGGPDSLWMFTSLCEAPSITSLQLYLNFDECAGDSVHNTSPVASSACWTCYDDDGPCTSAGIWDTSIVETLNCTTILSVCKVQSGSNDSNELWGLPVSTYIWLGCVFLVALIVCGTSAAYLGKRYRRYVNKKYHRMREDQPPHVPEHATYEPPSPVLSSPPSPSPSPVPSPPSPNPPRSPRARSAAPSNPPVSPLPPSDLPQSTPPSRHRQPMQPSSPSPHAPRSSLSPHAAHHATPPHAAHYATPPPTHTAPSPRSPAYSYSINSPEQYQEVIMVPYYINSNMAGGSSLERSPNPTPPSLSSTPSHSSVPSSLSSTPRTASMASVIASNVMNATRNPSPPHTANTANTGHAANTGLAASAGQTASTAAAPNAGNAGHTANTTTTTAAVTSTAQSVPWIPASPQIFTPPDTTQQPYNNTTTQQQYNNTTSTTSTTNTDTTHTPTTPPHGLTRSYPPTNPSNTSTTQPQSTTPPALRRTTSSSTLDTRHTPAHGEAQRTTSSSNIDIQTKSNQQQQQQQQQEQQQQQVSLFGNNTPIGLIPQPLTPETNSPHFTHPLNSTPIAGIPSPLRPSTPLSSPLPSPPSIPPFILPQFMSSFSSTATPTFNFTPPSSTPFTTEADTGAHTSVKNETPVTSFSNSNSIS